MNATLLVRAGHVHTLGTHAETRGVIALAGDRVLGSGRTIGDLDAMRGPESRVVELPDLCILPGFADAHMHQLQAEQDIDGVDVRPADTIADVLRLVADQAAQACPGEWVVTRRGWHESRLVERRLPTTSELDTVTQSHPVLLRRGSHLAVLNSAALERAGDVAERDGAGERTGFVRGMDAIVGLLHDTTEAGVDNRVAALARVCRWHASRGLVGVREAGITMDDVAVYERLAGTGGLTVRTDVLLLVPPDLSQAGKLDLLGQLGPPPRQRGPFLRVDGIKLLADGRVEDAAMREPYPGRGQDRGVLHMDVAELVAVTERAVALGWRVGCHVVGDRALDTVLDAYEAVLKMHRELPAGWLVVEHALVADEAQRRRTAALGVGVTVQHPLLDGYAGLMIDHWGAERVAGASPVRGWLEAGALVAAGSDGHVVPFDPLRSLWGLATRGTADAGILGAEQGVSQADALRLYTTSAHWLTGWRTQQAGFEPGGYADLVAFPRCVLASPPDALIDGLEPVLTVVGGEATYDPGGRWSE